MSFFGAAAGPFGAAPGGAFGVPAAAPFGAAAPAPAPASSGGIAPDGDVSLPIPAGTDSISTIQWSPNGQYLSAGTWDNKVRARSRRARRGRAALTLSPFPPPSASGPSL
jgi:hypothetical protein